MRDHDAGYRSSSRLRAPALWSKMTRRLRRFDAQIIPALSRIRRIPEYPANRLYPESAAPSLLRGSMTTPSFDYDVFLSYSTDPDYRLARDLESFLETFHELPHTESGGVRPLRVCRDGSDFKVPREASDSGIVSARETIRRHLERSAHLVVVCSRNAALSPWVQFECSWFLEHRGASRILLCVSEGADPLTNDASLFPEPVRAAKLPEQLWYDLRGFRGKSARRWVKVRDYDDECVRIAAELIGVAAGEIRPVWMRERERLARRNATRRRNILGVLSILVMTAGFFFLRYRTAAFEELRVRSQSEFVTGADAISRDEIPVAVGHMVRAMQIDPTATAASRRLASLLSQRLIPSRQSFGFTRGSHVMGARFDDDGKQFVTIEKGGQARVWTLETHTHAALPLLPAETVRTAAFAPRDGGLLTGSNRGRVDMWDTRERVSRTASLNVRTAVERVVFTPQGDLATVVDAVGKVHVLAVGRRRLSLRYARAFPTPVTSVDLSLTGRLLAVATPEGVFVLDLATGRTLHTLDVPDGWNQVSAKFTPDGSRLVIAGGSLFMFVSPGVAPGYDGGGFQVWDVRSGAPVSSLVRSVAGLKDLDVSADGARAAVGAVNGEVALLDLQKGALIPTRGHRAAVEDVEFSPDGSALITASFDGKVRIWGSETGAELAEPMTHRVGVSEAHFRPDGAAVATVSGDGEVTLWKMPVRAPVFVYSEPRAWASGRGSNNADAPAAASPVMDPAVRSIARQLGISDDRDRASAHASLAAFALRNGTVQIWNLRTRRHRRTIAMPDGYRGEVGLVKFSPTGNFLATAQEDPDLTARIWDARTGREHGSGITNTGEVTSIAFSPDESLVAAGTASGAFAVWNTRTGARAFPQIQHPGETNLVAALAFNGDGSLLATYGLNSHDLLLWDTKTGKPLTDPFKLSTSGTVTRLSFDGDSRISIVLAGVARPYTLNLCGIAEQRVGELINLAEGLLPAGGAMRATSSPPRRPRGAADPSGECIDWLADAGMDPPIQPGVPVRLSAWIRELLKGSEDTRSTVEWLRTQVPFNPIAKASLVYTYAASDPQKAEAYAAPLLRAGVTHPAVAYFLAEQSIVAGNLRRADSLLSLPIPNRSQEFPLDSLRGVVRHLRAMAAARSPVRRTPPSSPERVIAGVRERYSLQVDRRWKVDRALAAEAGMQLLMHTRGFTYKEAPAVVYSNSRPLDAQIRNVEDFIQNTIRGFAMGGHTITVGGRDSARTADGRTALIAMYEADPSYPHREAGAYIVGRNELIYLVYTARSATLFQRHLPEFLDVIRSLRVGPT